MVFCDEIKHPQTVTFLQKTKRIFILVTQQCFAGVFQNSIIHLGNSWTICVSQNLTEDILAFLKSRLWYNVPKNYTPIFICCLDLQLAKANFLTFIAAFHEIGDKFVLASNSKIKESFKFEAKSKLSLISCQDALQNPVMLLPL